MEPEDQNELDQKLEEIRLKDEAKDTTILTYGVLIIFGSFLLLLFVGDMFFSKTYLTAELIHSVAGWLGGYISAIITAKIGKKAAEIIKDHRKNGRT